MRARRRYSSADLAEAKRERLRVDFPWFMQAAMVEAAAELQIPEPIIWTNYLDAMARHAQAWCWRELKHLLINVKNKALKSGVCSVGLPPWSWLDRPKIQWFTGGHAAVLAVDHCRSSRDLIRSPFFQDLIRKKDGLPEWLLSSDQDVKSYYINTLGGHRFSAWPPRGTGARATHFLLDDVLAIEEARSETANVVANSWTFRTVKSRMNNPASDGMCIVGHRLRRDDVSFVMTDVFGDSKDGGDVEVLSLPLEYSKARRRPPTKLGYEDPRTQEGESLDPIRWPPKVIEEEKKSQGDLYEALSNQNPQATGMSLLKMGWFKRWTSLPARASVVQSWDFSFKGLDPTIAKKIKKRSKVGGICGWVVPGAIYIVDHTLDFMDYIQQKDALRDMYKRNPRTVRSHIEDEANGSALLLEMGLEYPGLNPVNPGKRGGKYQRLAAISHFVRSGNIFVPPDDAYPWVRPFLECLCNYPQVDYTEEVDIFSQLISEEWLPHDELPTEDQLAEDLRRMIQ